MRGFAPPGRPAVWSLLAIGVLVVGCSGGTSSATTPAATAAANEDVSVTETVAGLVAAAGELEAADLAGFVLRPADVTEVAENFRVWRDAPIDYDAYEDTDPILLSSSVESRGADLGHVAHLVGRDGLTIVHAITAAERYPDAATATDGFAATTESMGEDCIALNREDTPLPGIGDEAVLVTAIRTCTFGDPASFGAIVARYGSAVVTAVIERGDRTPVADTVAALADQQSHAIAETLSGTPRSALVETSTFGLCIPDPDDPAGSELDKNWRERSTDLIRTFTQPGSTADRDRAAIHQAVLDTLAQANAVLGTTYGGPIDVYFYETIEQLQRASPSTDDHVLGFAFGQEVHQLCGGTLDGTQWINMAMSAHEYTHIITLNLWGRTSSQVLIEGLAHYATVGERDSMVANFRIEPLQPLAATEDDDARFGRAWGTLLSSYLIEEFDGIDQFRDLWFAARTADLATSVEAIYGLTLDELDAAIRTRYDLKPAP